jgi:hypothetical protein
MPTAPEKVRLWGKTGSDRTTVKTTLLTHSDMGALVGLVLLFTVRSGKAPTVLTLTATLKS